MPRVKNSAFWESAKWNNASFMQYFNRLVELSVSMFDWKNVPDTVDVRFLELALFGDGMALFFKDDVLGYLGLRCMIGGELNQYQIPTERMAYSAGYQSDMLDDTNSVIIFNNFTHTPSTLDVEVFSKRLWDYDRTVDINIHAQKTPVLIQCDETQRLSMKNLYMKYDGNVPVIFADKSLNPNGIKVLKTDAPFVARNIYDLKTQYWNEALTYLGISNTNIQKKERMISDEVTRNLGGVIASRYCRLEPRRTACKQINKLFGLNMDVDYREDYRELDDEYMIGGQSEDEEVMAIAKDYAGT